MEAIAPLPPASKSAANASPRRASITGRARAPSLLCEMPRASAASEPTGAIGISLAWASARAVAIPIRRPVNDPGPIPTAIRSILSQPPARLDASLDLPQQHLGVARPPVGTRVDPGLADDLARCGHPDDRVGGRAIDTEHHHQ